MADLELTVDLQDLVTGGNYVEGFQNRWAKMVQSVITESVRVSKAVDASSEVIYEAFSRIVDQDAEKYAKEVAKIATAYQKVRESIDPLYAASNKLETKLEAVDDAFLHGVISAEEYDKAIYALRNSLDFSSVNMENGLPTVDINSVIDTDKISAEFDKLRMSMDSTYASEVKLAQGMELLDTALYSGVITTEDYNAAMLHLKTGLDAVTIASNKAAQSKEYWDRFNTSIGITGTKATESGATFSALQAKLDQTAQSYEKLRMAMDPAYAKQVQLNTNIKLLDDSLEQGIITQTEYTKALYALENGLDLAGNKMTLLGNGSISAGRKMSRGSMIAQQFGYQIGDFFVQVQSGQSALVAFAQQGTQLAGLLPGVAGAVIGIGLAASTLAAGFFKAKGSVEETEGSLKDLGSALETLESINFVSNLDLSVRDLNSSFTETLNLLDKITREKIQDALAEPTDKLKDALLSWDWDNNWDLRFGGSGADFDFMGFDEVSDAVDAYQILKEISGDTTRELAEQVDQALLFLKGSGLLTKELEDQLSLMIEQTGILEELKNTQAQDFYESQSQTLTDQVSLLEKKLQFGEDSKEYRQAEYDIALRDLEAQAEILGIAEDKVAVLRDALLEAQGLTEEDITRKSALKATADIIKEAVKDSETQRNLVRETTAAYESQRLSLVQKGVLLDTQAKYGRDSLEYLKEQNAFELANLSIKSLASGMTMEQVSELVALTKANQEIVESNFLINKAMEETKTIIDDVVAASREQRDAIEDADQAYESMNSTIRQQVELLEVQKEYGKDSYEYRKAQYDIEVENLIIKQRARGVDEERINLLVEALRHQQSLTEQILSMEEGFEKVLDLIYDVIGADLEGAFSGAVAKADSLANSLSRTLGIVGSIMRSINSITFDNIALEAENKALTAGASAGQAAIEGQLAQTQAELSSQNVDPFFQNMIVSAERAALERKLVLTEENQALLDKLNSSSTDSPSGSGGGLSESLDAVETLEMEIDRRKTLLRMGVEEGELLEEIWSITDSLGKDRSKYSASFIEALAKENIAIAEQEEAYQKVLELNQSIIDTVSDGMSSAIDSMIDGTSNLADAFSDMTVSILQDLAKIIIQQNIIGSFDMNSPSTSSGLVGMFGSLFFGGKAVGGSLNPNEPTWVGENGPELIVPKHSGTVVNNQQSTSTTQQGGTLEIIVTSDESSVVTIARNEANAVVTQKSAGIVSQAQQATLNSVKYGSKNFIGL